MPSATELHPERLLHLLGPTPSVHKSPTARIWRALMLAPTLEICVALLNKESVPLSALDPLWVKRFGIR